MVEVSTPAEEDEQHLTATERAVELVEIAAGAAADKLATDIIAYDVSEQLVITDAFLLCSASNDRQVKAIVDEIEEKLRRVDAKPVRREGEREGRWVLLDYIDVVIHVQHAEERVFYALERLWKDCPVIALPEPAIAGPARRPGSTGSGGSAGSAGPGAR
jgi:ribosome-associated protein